MVGRLLGPEALGNEARGGTMFPDDQGDNYDRNPTEGWAEAYRVSAGLNPTDWSIVSDIFRPNAATQQIALLDATDPWPGASTSTTNGKLLKGRAKTTKLRISVPQDGRVIVRLTSSKGLNADLDLFNSNSRTRVGSSRQRGRSDSVTGTFCGQRTLVARVTRTSGSGSFKLTASTPAP
ncbi:MAG: hypothetical protein NTZ58_06655 [Solirubrobacterales bacterium]|nr:hypothetical protein [Solirubrobacterales bacterium]